MMNMGQHKHGLQRGLSLSLSHFVMRDKCHELDVLNL